MTKKLNQLLAIEKGIRQQTQKEITELHRVSQKEELYDGLDRTYSPFNEDGEPIPPEKKVIQQRAEEVLDELKRLETNLINVVASKDMANTRARADVEVEGEIKIELIPVTHLLWLEKQLEDIHTFVSKMPTLDPSVKWEKNDSQACMSTDAIHTNRTQKIPRNHVLSEATKEHPAQVQVYMEDKAVGYWSQIRHSARLTMERKTTIISRIRRLQEAVKQAREKANLQEVIDEKIGDTIMEWLFL